MSVHRALTRTAGAAAAAAAFRRASSAPSLAAAHRMLATQAAPAAAAAATAAAPAAAAPHTTVSVGILLKRSPVVLPELSEFQQAYYAYREDMERSEARPFDHTFYFKKGSSTEKRWLDAQKAAAAAVSGSGSAAASTVAQPLEDELAKLEKAPRLTAADAKGDVKSLDRALQRTLYLVVKQKDAASAGASWRFPQGSVLGNELLHEAAPARLADACGDAMDTWFVGKAPVGHAKDSTKTVFYMKAHILAGKVVPSGKVTDHAWLTKQELASKLEPEYYAQVSGMLSDL
ncbi:39S mitochondrial ribosomal protein L46-domain-containing protein [Entophlyctis helioformis]|nr:39S mitochondrial ribosomal protein L46-domain-containing protein [Entophlyctis helioformis]